MSVSGSNPQAAGMSSVEGPSVSPNASYKSYKKKYRKMRLAFDEKMKHSNNLFSEEQKITRLARRLQEQNDQLLDLLLDVNDLARLPPNLRYDLRSPPPEESAIPGLIWGQSPARVYDFDSVQAALEEAKSELAAGQMSSRSYDRLETELMESVNQPKSLAQLSAATHTPAKSLPRDQLPFDIGELSPVGYLTPTHEEEYLAMLDSGLDSQNGNLLSSHPIRANEKHEREKEAALKNPVSVYNWLRKHQPQVFLQDSESQPEKPERKPISSTKSGKRNSVAPKQEDIIDEEGLLVLPPAEVSSKVKRKREDEPYRPKGGSSRPTKKKRTSGGGSDRRKGFDEDEI